MWQWLTSNLVTVIASLCVLALISIAVAVLVKGRKQGCPSCGNQCSGCPMCGSCHHTDAK